MKILRLYQRGLPLNIDVSPSSPTPSLGLGMTSVVGVTIFSVTGWLLVVVDIVVAGRIS